MMYGHVETLEERVEHMRRIRELQDETRGAFISWTFQRDATGFPEQVLSLEADLVRLSTTQAVSRSTWTTSITSNRAG